MLQSGAFPSSSQIRLHVGSSELQQLLLKRVDRLKRRHASLGEIIKSMEQNSSHDDLRRSASFQEKVDELHALARSATLTQFQADHLIADRVYDLTISDMAWIADD